ncbi:type VI secretion system baseplate subunit TssE [Oleomonas cavernae]|uniref:type VI secretion system baseplate subunit TssE n=1 Tax=Oleomonas cavernae TaxID=2320859 RepID=UPI0013150236|nr:type VI secretion system baseplate subunit TssE [Oleomonas cavernae]
MSDATYIDQPLTISVLDRLVEPATGSGEVVRTRGASLRELKAAVRRDLEVLLNARQRCRSWAPDLAELEASLINFGIPDFTAGTFDSQTRIEALRRAIEEAIRRFEPRFESVSVEITGQDDTADRTFRIRVNAMMYADPAPEPIVLDSVLESATRTFAVVENEHE